MAETPIDIVLRMQDRASRPMVAALGRIGRSLGGVRSALAGLVTAGALVEVTRRTLTYADAVAKTADKIGVGTDALQELRFAADRSGVSQKQLDMGLQRFSRRLAEAAEGGGALGKVLDQYGISVKDADGRTREVVDVLADLADVVATTESGSEQLRIAFKAFDSEGAALVNMLRGGSRGMGELRDRARELGAVLEESALRQAEATNDALTDLSYLLQNQTRAAFLAAAPAIERAAEAATELILEIDWVAWGEDVGAAARGVADSLGPVADLLGALLTDFRELAEAGKVTTLLQAAGELGIMGPLERLRYSLADTQTVLAAIQAKGTTGRYLLEELGLAQPAAAAGPFQSGQVLDIHPTPVTGSILPDPASFGGTPGFGADGALTFEESWQDAVHGVRFSFTEMFQAVIADHQAFANTLQTQTAEYHAWDRAATQAALAYTQSATGDAAQLFRQLYEDSGGAAEKYWRAYKAMAVAETVVATASSIMGIWESFSRYGPPGVAAAAALSATVGALGAAKIALIARQQPATAFAEGGIVTGPVQGLVGEAGSEAIIPLHKLPEMVGKIDRASGGTVVEITNNVQVRGGMGEGDVAALRQAVAGWTVQGVRQALAADKQTRQVIRRMR